jgi:cytochrome b561
MSLRNTSTRWGPVARFLHWLFLFLLIGAWYAVEMHEEFPKGTPERSQWMQLHFAIGISVFVLLWVRLGWRLSGDVPAPLPGPRWQQVTSALVHAALYLILIVMPLTGLLTTQLAGRAVSWFGLIDIPLFLQKNSELAEQMEEVHGEVLWPVLLALVGLHAVAALWHHFVLKDETLKRMLPFRRS